MGGAYTRDKLLMQELEVKCRGAYVRGGVIAGFYSIIFRRIPPDGINF